MKNRTKIKIKTFLQNFMLIHFIQKWKNKSCDLLWSYVWYLTIGHNVPCESRSDGADSFDQLILNAFPALHIPQTTPTIHED